LQPSRIETVPPPVEGRRADPEVPAGEPGVAGVGELERSLDASNIWA
jgi:hypothetical protein